MDRSQTTYTPALYIAVFICAGVSHLHPSQPLANTMDNLISAAFFMSLGATLITTALIVHRILRVVRATGAPSTAARRIATVVDLVVQSAVVYSVSLLANAITTVVSVENTRPGALEAIGIAEYFVPLTLPFTAVRDMPWLVIGVQY